MTRVSAGEHQSIESLADAAAASLSDILRVNQGGLDEFEMSLSQVAVLIRANGGSSVFDNIVTSSITASNLLTTSNIIISGLTAGLSAASYTLTGQTSAAFATVTSGVNFGMQTKGQFEALIALVLNNEAAIDELRA